MQIEKGLFNGHFLQRRCEGAHAAISGSCENEGPVIATARCGKAVLPWYQMREIGHARKGRFDAVLSGLPAGGPYTITVACGGDSVQIREVFVGDIWLMAGQSNMEGCALMNGNAEPHPQVRCFTMARRWETARDPLHLKLESPDPVHGGKALTRAAAQRLRRQAKRGAGLGIHFGRLMHQRTGVPQGFIATASGGTTMKQWDPALRRLGGESLYGSMWMSLRAVGQPIAGVLWFQGESEALPALARAYTQRMRRLVSAVRRDLGQPQLPWLMVQIGRFIKSGSFAETAWPDPKSWNRVQERQRLLPKVISNCAVVPSIDLELDDCAHLGAAAFSILASRLANAAAGFICGDKSVGQEISPVGIRLQAACPPHGPQIHIEFSGVVGDLKSAGFVRGFTLLGAKGHPIPVVHRVRINGGRIILQLTEKPPRGGRLAYGYGLDPSCSLTDDRGMAVPVFGPLPISL